MSKAKKLPILQFAIYGEVRPASLNARKPQPRIRVLLVGHFLTLINNQGHGKIKN